MTDEQINERIAKLQGYDFDPECARGWWSRGRWVQAPNGELLFKHGIPNYAADLNACHVFEKTLDGKQAGAFHDWLETVQDCDRQEDCPAAQFWYHATARQRCEAFLRVHGQWKEEA